MGSRRLSRFPFAGAALAVALVVLARAGEPSPRELIALAPVLDSSDGRCRSLDIGGYFRGDKDPWSSLRFRALYRAPNQSSLLISDAVDGTPLAFCSGRKMFVYDPVGPTVYYSENAGFTLKLTRTKTAFKFDFKCLLWSRSPHHIVIDFHSVLSGFEGRAAGGGVFEDRVVKRNTGEFELIRNFDNRPYLTLDVDLRKECPYMAAAFVREGITWLCFDRLALNGALGNEPFAFPAKRRLTRRLPVKDVTAVEDLEVLRSTAWAVGRAGVVRALVNGVRPPSPVNIPGFSGVDWARVKENDKKFAKTLRDLVPLSLRAQ